LAVAERTDASRVEKLYPGSAGSDALKPWVKCMGAIRYHHASRRTQLEPRRRARPSHDERTEATGFWNMNSSTRPVARNGGPGIAGAAAGDTAAAIASAIATATMARLAGLADDTRSGGRN
jgi:hypothetical protein